MKSVSFGTAMEREAHEYTIENRYLSLSVSDLGATITKLVVKGDPDIDVVLGFDDASQYVKSSTYFGATVGRVANRIAGARFVLEGKEYPLFVNDKGVNCLHGGRLGFSRRYFGMTPVKDGINLSLVSRDMDEGFPGELSFSVTFLIKGPMLTITYEYETTRATPAAFTNHSYFNLNGSGDVLHHRLRMAAPRYYCVNGQQIPEGEAQETAGTDFDFLSEREIGAALNSKNSQFEITKYYDHPFLFGKEPVKAVLTGDKSGIEMSMYTTMPGVQLYSGNFVGGEKGKGGEVYPDYAGVCLETQYTPNSLNASSGEMIAYPGKKYHSSTVYCFKRLV